MDKTDRFSSPSLLMSKPGGVAGKMENRSLPLTLHLSISPEVTGGRVQNRSSSQDALPVVSLPDGAAFQGLRFWIPLERFGRQPACCEGLDSVSLPPA